MKYCSNVLCATFILFFTGSLFALNLEKLRIDRKPVVDESNPDQRTVMNVLIFPEIDFQIPLARSATIHDDSSNRDIQLGFDPDTLKIEWLKKAEMIWIHWSTFPQGTGGFNHDGHIVMSLTGNRWKEIFRHNFMAYSRGGWWHQLSNSLGISYDDSLRLLKLNFSGEEFSAVEKKPEVFTKLDVDSDVSDNFSQNGKYRQTSVMKDILTYEFTDEKLIFQYGYKVFDAGINRFPAEILAREFRTSVSELHRLNPSQKFRKKITGEIIVADTLTALKTNEYDGLNGGL